MRNSWPNSFSSYQLHLFPSAALMRILRGINGVVPLQSLTPGISHLTGPSLHSFAFIFFTIEDSSETERER